MEIGDKYGIIEATVIGIISGLVKTERIRVPGQPQVKGINPNKIHIYFDNSPDMITCSLEKIEERLIKKYGKLTSDKRVVTFSGSKRYIDSRKQR